MKKITIFLISVFLIFSYNTPSVGEDKFAGSPTAQTQAIVDSLALRALIEDVNAAIALLATKTALRDTSAALRLLAAADSARLDTLMKYVKPSDSLLCWLAPIKSKKLNAEGDTIFDVSGKGNHAFAYGLTGTDSSGPSYINQIGQWGFAEDGSNGDSVVTKPDVVVLDSTDNQSLSFWWKCRSVAITWQDIFTTRLDTSGTSVGTNYGILIANKKDTLRIRMNSPGGTTADALPISRGYLFAVGRVYHIALVCSGLNRVAYINGDSISGLSNSNRIRRTNKIRLGGWNQSTDEKPIGVYADVRLYRRALSKAEIQTIYNNGLRQIPQPGGPTEASVAATVHDSVGPLRTAIDSINPKLNAEIARQDSMAYWTVLDTLPTPNLSGSGSYIWGVAGDTTSPGLVYKVSGTRNNWFRADTSVSVRGIGLAMDSINKGAACRFLIFGTFRKSTWTWSPGQALFSDSAVAGEINIGGQASPKKMQFYGTVTDSINGVIHFSPDATIAH